MYPLYENHSFLLWAFYLVFSYGSGTPFLWYGTSGKNRVVPDSPIALSMQGERWEDPVSGCFGQFYV